MSDLLPRAPIAEYKGLKIFTKDAVSTAMKYVDEGSSELSEHEVRDMFDFVREDVLRNILVRDFLELQTCNKLKLSKSTFVLCGSIVETLLINHIISDPERLSSAKQRFDDIVRSKKPERVGLPPEKWWFAEIIDVYDKLVLVRKESIVEVWKLNGYRNIIHPMSEISTKKNISSDLAQIAFHTLKMIIDELRTL